MPSGADTHRQDDFKKPGVRGLWHCMAGLTKPISYTSIYANPCALRIIHPTIVTIVLCIVDPLRPSKNSKITYPVGLSPLYQHLPSTYIYANICNMIVGFSI